MLREILSMLLVVSVICSGAGFLLAYLKESTAPIIEAQVLQYVEGPAIYSVYRGADNDPIADRKSFSYNDKNVNVFPYFVKGKLVGVALLGSDKGYGGDIGVVVGISTSDDQILGIGITEMRETPGVGTVVAEPVFTKQFDGKKAPLALTSKGGDIDAVSGATISSVGTLGAVNKAWDIYQALKSDILQVWK